MCVCVCVCVYVCMCVCVSVCERVWACACVRTPTYICIYRSKVALIICNRRSALQHSQHPNDTSLALLVLILKVLQLQLPKLRRESHHNSTYAIHRSCTDIQIYVGRNCTSQYGNVSCTYIYNLLGRIRLLQFCCSCSSSTNAWCRYTFALQWNILRNHSKNKKFAWRKYRSDTTSTPHDFSSSLTPVKSLSLIDWRKNDDIKTAGHNVLIFCNLTYAYTRDVTNKKCHEGIQVWILMMLYTLWGRSLF